MGNRQDAEDAAQEVILKVYRKLHLFRGEASFNTWLNYVAANTCRDLLRKRKRQQTVSLDTPMETEDGQIDRELASEERSPEDEVVNNDLMDQIREALNQLNEDHRTILLMREYQELSYHEISEILQISQGTVKSRLSRARKELKTTLQSREQLTDYVRQME